MIQEHLRVVALMRLFPDAEPFDLVMFLVLSAHSKKGHDVSVRPRFWLRLCEPHFSTMLICTPSRYYINQFLPYWLFYLS